MPKHPLTDISKVQKRLNYLLVMRSIEKSTEYDKEIEKLQSVIDYYDYGIKPTKKSKEEIKNLGFAKTELEKINPTLF